MTENNGLLNIASLKQESLVDGVGLRTVIYFQGCSHKCLGCQNLHTWDFNNINLVSVQYILNYIKSDNLSDGVTFSGGCPMCQNGYLNTVISLSEEIKKLGLTLWCYCGETFEQLKGKQLELLKHIDVLVDGKYEVGKRDDTLAFRGSSNQRIIDVKKSLDKKEVELWE